ncbi:MAG: glycerol-3-phosphate 1-O-acyltransferase PlsY [Chloroflexota bacterium]
MGNAGWLALIAAISYLLGSIPSAVIISKKVFGFDIREKGSGNPGSTNAFRVLGWKWGIAVQLIDIAKGVAAVLIAAWLGQGLQIPNGTWFEDLTLIKIGAGLFAVIGHVWSAFAGFRGGKGINTALGMLLSVAPVDVSIAAGIFVLAVIMSGYISLGSLLAAFTVPSSLFVRYNFLNVDIPGYSVLIYFSLAVTLLVIYTHRSNIKRLLSGRENRFNKLRLIKF